MLRFSLTLLVCVLCQWTLVPSAAHAQTIAGCKTDDLKSLRSVQHDANHVSLTGNDVQPIRIDCDDMQLIANTVELFMVDGRIIASGDLVFVIGETRISAERLEFNTKTKTGTFYQAFGTTVMREKATPGQFGTQEPNAFFWGEELHKSGPKQYKIVRGGFTACVQPTPRWDVASGSITVNLDDYALLRNAVFRVKGVPMLYLPIFYYPMEEDDRATGFLMPIYGSSRGRGQSLTTPFFWAINRSQDLTISHDWHSKLGQGVTADYRYVAGAGSSGDATFNYLKEREITAESDPTQAPRPGQTSYTVRGVMSQALPLGLRAQASANYFTSLATQQLYQQDVYQATRRDRSFNGSLSGSWSGFNAGARIDRQEYFYAEDDYTRSGSVPRINLSFSEPQVAGLPVSFRATSEYARIDYGRFRDGEQLSETGLTKMDFSPTVQVPFKVWPFLTVNSSVGWRFTHWSESIQPGRGQVEEPITRSFFDFQTRIVGPVFNRVFNTPGGGFAEKYKHVVEPSVTIRRTTKIDNFDQIVVHGYGDYILGDVTRYTYALENMLYAKKEASREILKVSLSQTYYSSAEATDFDTRYTSIISKNPKPTNFSPVELTTRFQPTPNIGADFRADWDVQVKTVRTLSTSARFRAGEQFDVSAGWSLRRLIPELPAFSVPLYATHYINAAANLRSPSNRVGGQYSFNYDMRNDFFLQQRVQAYYNAQCCGVVAEFQTFNFVGVYGVRGIEDRRFNISFSLAGIGTFSNFLGAFGIGQERRY
jgi:LPS-assembly protein